MSEYYDKLLEYVLDGEEEEALELTRNAINDGMEPLDIVQKCLIPILDGVGDKFAKLELFLPDLIMAADVAKVVKDEVRAHLLNDADGAKNAGKIVIGTVQGDVHDIGKNIVATLLEVNNYEVIDLGNDVAPYDFVETAKRENVDIICMSSLLTTSMPFMVDVIKLLNGLGIRDKYKIAVGGGPVSKEWAMSIGADGYSEDANEAVILCDKLIADGKAG